MKLLFEYIKTDYFNISVNGLQLIDRDGVIEIYNDPFRSVPLFIARDASGELIIFSKFEHFYNIQFIDKSIDQAGFWEIIFFGSGLWTRTLYKNVQQMPAATCLTINKSEDQFSIKRYWNYSVKEDSSIQTIEEAADRMYVILDKIFASLDKSKSYILGMSGGLDSRITLAFLSKHISKNKIRLFTYGFDENILEYQYAKDIAKSLAVSEPVFHQLNIRSYREALNYLPTMSGGQISINHSHIIDYLKNTTLGGLTQISTYFSDAVFGFDCVYPKHLDDIDNNYYAEIIRSIPHISLDIKKIMINDSLNIFLGFDTNSNFSSLDEFKYVTERNQKFHMLLAHIQGRFLDMLPIYANMELLNYCLAVPIKFRQNKKIIDILLDKYFVNISTRDFKNISSRDFKNISYRFQWKSKYAGLISWHFFRALNRVNSILRVVTRGKIQLINKYQTEEHERLLYSDFRVDLNLATSKFVDLGILSKAQKDEFDRLPIRSSGVAERYALISLSKII